MDDIYTPMAGALIVFLILCWGTPELSSKVGQIGKAVMRKFQRKRLVSRLAAKTEGAASVEFAIILNVLLLLILGMIDFGHAWFIRQIITNASREGARVGVVYQVPLKTETEVRTAVMNYLQSAGLNDPTVSTVTFPDGPPGASGTQFAVAVTTTKTWWIIDKFVPSLGSSIQMTAQTSMRME